MIKVNRVIVWSGGRPVAEYVEPSYDAYLTDAKWIDLRENSYKDYSPRDSESFFNVAQGNTGYVLLESGEELEDCTVVVHF